ncbi:hypothetical protein A1O7_01475 [Cladophialophora yegresii CBS 114405]|uniref:Uncharacterized protein n=1 Tax=Cladophialophora yegresii CBS 114405 TaxID=1182544 RepID=W9WJI5_9EURO|nr:uncharacterized protein A1O7_01475 [Cladophialophora yegresii CBS 114405]EXJ65135.1 hypothetical protein A1O7_01475 [Cladophialophora yegresii CBS 114405]
MLLSSRSNPPKPLKFGTTKSDRYLSIKHLLPSTPIPSPSLPSILPRHGKKPPKLNSRKIVRSILWLSFLIGVYYLVSFGKRTSRQLAELTFLTSLGKTYEIIEASELPDYPTPLAVTDATGKHYWTISIPQNLPFPLPPTDYADICSQALEVGRHVVAKPSKPKPEHTATYYHEDASFIDVAEAQARNFLPPEPSSIAQHSSKDGPLPVCDRSLTYILDATDAGLGSALLGIWLSYSLAQREGRAFFIDDTHFPYGNYSTFFTSMPQPDPPCRLPPVSHRVPCPHQANHLVVSAATTPWVFGQAFHAHFSRREIFDLAHEGYEALFHLRPEDAAYALNRASKLRAAANDNGSDGDTDTDSDAAVENGLVGIHIRRGDRHPFSLAYSQNYIPPEQYMSTARRLVGQSPHWRFLVASDDADMYEHVDLGGARRAQEKISLASKKSLERMGHKGGEVHGGRGGRGALGWEGGFFKDVFWGLGLPEELKWETKKVGSPMPMKEKHRFGEKGADGREKRVHHHEAAHRGRNKVAAREAETLANENTKESVRQDGDVAQRDYRTDPTKEALQLRELLGRAYLLDLAMLAQSDKVVCGVSANACRILAVMLGWERAFEKKDWNNVDGGYEWRIMDY